MQNLSKGFALRVIALGLVVSFTSLSAMAQIPAANTCSLENEKNAWLVLDQRHQAFQVARGAFSLFKLQLKTIPSTSFAPANPTPADLQRAEHLRDTTIYGAVTTTESQFEALLEQIITIRNPACDVCVAVERYKQFVKPINDANLDSFVQGEKIQFKDLRVYEIKNKEIYDALVDMSGTVGQYVENKRKYDSLSPTSPQATALAPILTAQSNAINNSWATIKRLRVNPPTPPPPPPQDLKLEDAQTQYACNM